ncbi:conserved protein of unknown function [Moritella yayanosii]|uniref:Uncharacterized protein n=1 Tax=Moritella yayanosii TaxID=69539 RepID=A0A330LNK3_9GAMM|nr:conserved protein of unknown function [Moritella yayanosii]
MSTLTTQPGIFLFKSGSFKSNYLSKLLEVEGLKSQMAEVGDVLLFSPDVTVIFDAESDGEAIYTAHRNADPSFSPAMDKDITPTANNFNGGTLQCHCSSNPVTVKHIHSLV